VDGVTVDGTKMFTPLVVLIIMAVLCSSAMTGEIPDVSFYLHGTEVKDLMQPRCKRRMQLRRATHCLRPFVIIVDESLSTHLFFCLL
jgi:hypothetical protein